MTIKGKSYYILTIIHLFGVTLFAQGYSYFPNSNANWNQRQTYNDGTQIIDNLFTVFIDNDTLINGISYHKLYVTGIENKYTITWSFVSSTSYTHQYYTSFREDSLKHIYTNDFGNESLLYDFNLKLYDTLNYLAYQYILVEGTYVSSIDSVQVGSKYRMRYHLTAPDVASDYITLIEGIGSSYGLLNLSAPQFEQPKTLLCFRSNEGDYILDSLNCNSVGLNEIFFNDQTRVFPNPSTGQINIKIIGNKTPNLSIEIYNILGNKIFSDKINTYNNEILQLPIVLPKGIFYLCLHFDHENQVYEFIVN